MALFEAIDHVFYKICSMEASVAFYRDVLGLALKRREGNDWAEFDVGGTDLALAGELATRPHQGGATVVLRTADLDAVEARLREHDVKRGTVQDMGGARMLDFYDPDGNEILAIQIM